MILTVSTAFRDFSPSKFNKIFNSVLLTWDAKCLDFAKYFSKSRYLRSARRSGFCETFRKLQTLEICNCEMFGRIQIFEIVTMELGIKDHDLMAEHQDDGIAELSHISTTGTFPVHKIPSAPSHNHSHKMQFNSFVLNFMFHVNSTDLSRFDKSGYCVFAKECFCMTFHV